MIHSAKEISKKSKSSFYYAFNLLPKKQREAMNIFYAFCRKTDDIVDNQNSSEIKLSELERWREQFNESLSGKTKNSLLKELSDVIKRFKIPLEPFYELFKGMEMDISIFRYKDFETLKQYCYRVASTVGLISIEIFGYSNRKTREFAVNLGIALQLTNILRDVKKDSEYGRIYLPLDEMNNFSYSENDLQNRKYNKSFVNLMKFQVERAETFFSLATSSLPKEDKKSMFPARAMQLLYYKLLQKIKKYNFDVFNNNIKITNFEKLSLVLKVLLETKLAIR